MRRYVKRAIAVLAVALMCSSLIGGGVMAEDGSGKDGNDGQAVEEAGSNEVVPEVSPEGASGETEGEESEITVEGAESALASVVSPQATYVKYSLDTSIVVNMQGRNFKSGDSFIYAVAPVDDAPVFNRFPLPYGDSDSPAYDEGTARINPTSGTTATLPLEENIQLYRCILSNCGYISRTSEERRAHVMYCGCGSYSVVRENINIAPEIIFNYPGTYDYIVFQTSMYTDDSDSIIADTTQYKVSVKVTASGSTLTPTLSSVKKSTDGGRTWVVVADKSKLAFTNKLMPDGARKGDIDRDGKVTMADVMACLNHVSKKKLLTGQALAAADVDGNGVGMSDVIKILNYVSKKSPSL
ncbi:MAG: hypothetical protein HFG82_14280 [Dorea sp.]|jgi:hypothetical protein|nr:hypothetical protein [Dorea sp.]